MTTVVGPTRAIEDAVRASFLDALGEAVVATDPAGHVVYWNDAASRLFGFLADEIEGLPVTDLLLVEGSVREAEAILTHVRREGSWSGEFVARHKAGRVFPVLVTANTVRNPDGSPAGVVGIARDISGQREAEAMARSAEERLELVHRAASTVIWDWDIQAGTVTWNDAMGDVFGYAAEDVGPTMDWWRSKLHPDDRDRVRASLDRFLSDDRRFWTDEYRFLTAENGYATVFDRAYLSLDEAGAPIRMVGTLVDLTERRRIHEEQRFLSQASMILDLSLDYESTLPTIARLAANGVCDACLIAVVARDGFAPYATAAHGDPRLQAVVEEIAELVATGPPSVPLLDDVVRHGESRLVRRVPDLTASDLPADGRLIELLRLLAPRSAMLVPLSARRRVVGYAILAVSGSKRLYDEADLRVAEELGRRLGLTVDHACLFQSAELANRAKADFLAIISHELRTPLTAVLGYSDLLAEEVAGPLTDIQHRQVRRIRAGSNRLLRLIEGILAFARLETGREHPRFDRVELRALLQHTDEMVRPAASEKGVDFRLRAHDVPETIHTDPERFVQVLLALLTNAIKFTEQGAVEVDVRARDGMLEVDVTDSGDGIAPEHMPHIFNPFWQAEQPATRRAGGAGLGLSVARRLARLMRGEVDVVETSPRGTTFRLQLPLGPDARRDC